MNLIPDVALAENTSQRLPCVVVLDGSTSMQGNAIQALNDGLKLLESDLKADDVARQRVRILVLRIGAPHDVEVVTDWVDAIEFEAPEIDANGTTPLGAGVRRALDEIEAEKARYRDHGIPYNRPWLFVLTDGEPTDPGWEGAADECRAAEENGRVSVFCVGVGEANIAKLARFSPRQPLALKGLAFREFFLWLSRSARAGSQSAPSENIQMAAPSDWAVIPGGS
ncbi:MAG: VWA domain-containing protein [Sphingomonas sp.]|uniref:vWA domain-containing protein n=1 Tax=Sphingomonas sp. TaxID=28214 RepID=UPI0025D0E938|nr:VWA domain-containing protein [Sphingomonas sp.]MBX3564115.1 VWA domain-containing protein [Sphingomonas sp.]